MKMRLKDGLKTVLSLGLLINFSVHATVFKKECGEYIYIVELYNGFDIFEKNYRLYFQDQNGKKRLFYQTAPAMILDAACVKDKKKRNLLLFREITGGNASPEDRYGVFDPHSNKMLLTPVSWEKGNSAEAEAIIGYSPPFPKYRKEDIFFCCDNLMYDSDD